jgi:lysophospholipase L1-like esterase
MNKFPPKGEVAFVGDSHIARADWNSLLNRSDIANYGVGGDGTTSLLKRLEPVINSGAKRAVLMIGVNDLFQGKTPEETAQNIFKIISALQKKMAVTVLSVMPTTGQFGDVNHKIAILDQKISALCVAACSFVDLRNVIGGTELKPEYSLEGLHLNTQGYIAISEPIAKAITQQH